MEDLVARLLASDEAFRSKTSSSSSSSSSSSCFSYGTAGFRARGDTLSVVAFRCGILSGLRSLSHTYSNRDIKGVVVDPSTGLVLTASHNPVDDNGVKLVDADGGMLAMNWETHAERLVNAKNAEDFTEAVVAILQIIQTNEEEEMKDEGNGRGKGRVFVARDTRPSGQRLLSFVIEGIQATGATVVGSRDTLRTTPQLHWQGSTLIS